MEVVERTAIVVVVVDGALAEEVGRVVVEAPWTAVVVEVLGTEVVVVDGAVVAGDTVVVEWGLVVGGTLVATVVDVTAPFRVIVRLSPGASCFVTWFNAFAVSAVAEDVVFTSNHREPSPTNRTAMSTVERRSLIRLETGFRAAANKSVSFMWPPERSRR